MRHPAFLHACVLALALLLLAGCVKNREKIVIDQDGGVRFLVAADGNASDLADGHPVPFLARFEPAKDDDTLAWIKASTCGNGAGGDASEWVDAAGKSRNVRLSMSSRFPSVQALPRFFAPESDPYSTAHLERSAALGIEVKNGRRVYDFLRVFHRREAGFQARMQAAGKALDDLTAKVKKGEALTPAERERATTTLASGLIDGSRDLAREAIGALYAEGDASLPLARRDAVMAEVDAALRDAVDLDRIRSAVAALEAAVLHRQPSQSTGTTNGLENFESMLRARTRLALGSALEKSGVASGAKNGILARLEWLYTREDVSTDLSDEDFEVEVELPGIVVSGNYSSSKDGRASWKFKGGLLRDGDIVMRAVSVLE